MRSRRVLCPHRAAVAVTAQIAHAQARDYSFLPARVACLARFRFFTVGVGGEGNLTDDERSAISWLSFSWEMLCVW